MIQQKQLYLRKNIIDQGYNHQLFCQMMKQKKIQDWQNLQVWTIKQLQDLVHQFKLKQKQVSSSQQIIQQFAQKKQKKVFFQKYKITDDYLHTQVKTQMLPQRTSIIHPSVIINKVQQKTFGGFIFGLGQQTQYFYTIQIPECRWQIIRKHSDLIWLRDQLSRLFPYHCIPVLKIYKKKGGDKKQMKRRAQAVQTFIQQLIFIPQLYNSVIFQGFFKNTQLKRFQKYKEGVQSTRFIKSISNVTSITGLAYLRISNGVLKLAQDIQKGINKRSLLYKQAKNYCQQLKINFTKASKSMNCIASSAANIQSSIAGNNTPQITTNPFVDIYCGLTSVLSEMAKQIENMGQELQNRLSIIFKNSSHQQIALLQLLKVRAQAEQQYLKEKLILQQKKSKLFQIKDLNQWQIGATKRQQASSRKQQILQDKKEAFKFICLQQTQNLNRLHSWYAFMNGSMIMQWQRLINIGSRRMKQSMNNFANSIRQSLRQQQDTVAVLRGFIP